MMIRNHVKRHTGWPAARLYILLFSPLLGCSDTPGDSPGSELTATEEVHVEDEHTGGDGLIRLSPAQVRTVGITLGELSEINGNAFVRATGQLDLPPDAHVSVSAKASGILRDVGEYVEGGYIKAGAPVATLENGDLLREQRAYLETAAEIPFLREELARQQELLDANAGIARDVQQARARLAAAEARLRGLRSELAFYGYDADALTSDNISGSVVVRAPVSGYIMSAELNDGMSVTSGQEILTIAEEGHMHVELNVYAQDADKVEVGQPVTYTVPSYGSETYRAEIYVIGRQLDESTKTVRMHAHPKGKQPRFVRGLFVEARVYLDSTTRLGLPEEAVVRGSGDGLSTVFATADQLTGNGEIAFRRIPARTSPGDDGMALVDLAEPLAPGERLVTHGAFFIDAQSRVSELEHDH